MELSSNQREFLYIAYESPPLLGGAVARTDNNCRLLPEFGWRPTLLTIATDNSEDVDRRYGEMGAEVLRARSIIKEERVRALPRGTGKTSASFLTWLLRLLARWLLIPDRHVLWKLPAQQLAMQAASSHNWQCVFVALYPITSAWLGQTIAFRLRLPFVLEFQDVVFEKFRGGPPTGIHRKIQRNIMRKAVRQASHIVVMSKAMKNWVVETYGVDSERVVVIPIGFLPEHREFVHSLPKQRNERFTMVYAGNFYRQRKPDTTLMAVRSLIKRKAIPADRLRLAFIGNLMPSIISQFGLNGVAETIPMIPRQEVFKWYANSDLLLLICDKTAYQNLTVPGKIFEYLMTEKPILGLADKNSEIAEILRESHIGFVVDADSPEEVASEIGRLYNLWNDNKLIMKPNKEFIEQFNSRQLTQRLVSVLEESVAASGPHKKNKAINR